MTITDKITALLSADPICGGRVTGETVRAIAGLVKTDILAKIKERQAVYLAKADACNLYAEPSYTRQEVMQHTAKAHDWLAYAIERGDFGAGEGA